MSDTNITTPLVQPSQNDLNGGVTNDGKRALEKYVRELFKAVSAISYFVSGNALPTTAANLVLIVPAGSAYISGYYVTWAATNVTLPASSTSHIFVKLIFSASLVSNVQIENNTSGTHPADAIKYGTVVTSGSAITSSTDQRLLDGNQRIRRAVISTTGTTSWIGPANVTRIRIRQWGSGGGGGGGGGGDGSFSGGYGSDGNAGGYCEAVLIVTPGQTVTVTNGAGGSGGSGGAFNAGSGSAGSDGTDGGSSSIVATGINFSIGGGRCGYGGAGAPAGGPSQPDQYFRNEPGGATASAGTADILIRGGGRGPGQRGAGSSSAGLPGSAGQNAVTIIEY